MDIQYNTLEKWKEHNIQRVTIRVDFKLTTVARKVNGTELEFGDSHPGIIQDNKLCRSRFLMTSPTSFIRVMLPCWILANQNLVFVILS